MCISFFFKSLNQLPKGVIDLNIFIQTNICYLFTMINIERKEYKFKKICEYFTEVVMQINLS